jgi:hypothetical protein
MTEVRLVCRDITHPKIAAFHISQHSNESIDCSRYGIQIEDAQQVAARIPKIDVLEGYGQQALKQNIFLFPVLILEKIQI